MKKIAQVQVLLLVLVLLSLSPAARAADEGTSSGTWGGGDIAEIRPLGELTEIWAKFIQNDLKGDMSRYLRWAKTRRSPAYRHFLKGLESRGLADDILKSSYEIALRGECIDSHLAGRAGTAELRILNGTICLSARQLAKISATRSEVLALAIHEHAHHFGILDTDYRLMRAVKEDALSYALENPPAGKLDRDALLDNLLEHRLYLKPAPGLILNSERTPLQDGQILTDPKQANPLHAHCTLYQNTPISQAPLSRTVELKLKSYLWNREDSFVLLGLDGEDGRIAGIFCLDLPGRPLSFEAVRDALPKWLQFSHR